MTGDHRLDFARAVDDWLRTLTAAKVRPRTIDAYRRTLHAAIDLLGDDVDPRTLVLEDYELVLAAWAPSVRANTLRNRSMALRAWDKWLAVRRGGRGQAAYLATIRRDETELRRLADVEVSAMFDAAIAAGPRDAAILTLLGPCALRNHEARSLLVTNVDLVQRIITLVEGKGGRGRVVPLGSLSVTLLREHLDDLESYGYGEPEHWLICRRHEGLTEDWVTRRETLHPDEPVGHSALNRAVTRIALAAGVDSPLGVTPHMFRRWAIEAFIAATGDLHSAAELAGHRDVNQTRHYAGRAKLGRTRAGVVAVEATIRNTRVAGIPVVGAPGFEPGTSATQPSAGIPAAPE